MRISISPWILLFGWGSIFMFGLYLNSLGNSQVNDQTETFKSILISNMKKGDVQKLSTYFSKEMVVGFDGDAEDVSAKTATVLLKDFFQNNPVKDFKELHHGQSKNGENQYLIGELKTANGKTYRVYIGFQENKINEITLK